MAKELSVIEIRLPGTVEKRLEQLAERTRRSKASYVKRLVIEHLQDIEDAEVADKRLQNLSSGKTRPVPIGQLLNKRRVNRERSAAHR